MILLWLSRRRILDNPLDRLLLNLSHWNRGHPRRYPDATAKPPQINEEPSEGIAAFILWGIPLGIVSGIIGIGGDVLMIPIMVFSLKFKMHQAVGTSTALMILQPLEDRFPFVSTDQAFRAFRLTRQGISIGSSGFFLRGAVSPWPLSAQGLPTSCLPSSSSTFLLWLCSIWD